jgi:hypothetical protein
LAVVRIQPQSSGEAARQVKAVIAAIVAIQVREQPLRSDRLYFGEPSAAAKVPAQFEG